MESPKPVTFDGVTAPYDAVPEGQPEQIDHVYPRGWRLGLISAGYLFSSLLASKVILANLHVQGFC